MYRGPFLAQLTQGWEHCPVSRGLRLEHLGNNRVCILRWEHCPVSRGLRHRFKFCLVKHLVKLGTLPRFEGIETSPPPDTRHARVTGWEHCPVSRGLRPRFSSDQSSRKVCWEHCPVSRGLRLSSYIFSLFCGIGWEHCPVSRGLRYTTPTQLPTDFDPERCVIPAF